MDCVVRSVWVWCDACIFTKSKNHKKQKEMVSGWVFRRSISCRILPRPNDLAYAIHINFTLFLWCKQCVQSQFLLILDKDPKWSITENSASRAKKEAIKYSFASWWWWFRRMGAGGLVVSPLTSLIRTDHPSFRPGLTARWRMLGRRPLIRCLAGHLAARGGCWWGERKDCCSTWAPAECGSPSDCSIHPSADDQI